MNAQALTLKRKVLSKGFFDAFKDIVGKSKEVHDSIGSALEAYEYVAKDAQTA